MLLTGLLSVCTVHCISNGAPLTIGLTSLLHESPSPVSSFLAGIAFTDRPRVNSASHFTSVSNPHHFLSSRLPNTTFDRLLQPLFSTALSTHPLHPPSPIASISTT